MAADSPPDAVEVCLTTAYDALYGDATGRARSWFRAAVALDPQCGEGWAGLGETGAGAAARSYARALCCGPGEWRWRMAWGEALLADAAFAEAKALFAAAVGERPGAAQAWRGLTLALEGRGQYLPGADAARQWLALAPGEREAACALARLLLGAGDPHGAADILGPFAAAGGSIGGGGDDPAVLVLMGRAWLALGETVKAKGVLERAVTAAPDDPAVGALLAAAGGDGAVQVPTPAYVRALFDRYAARFDHDLVETLGYDAPAILAAAVGRLLGEAAGLRVLDLGCGTGLSGVPFRRRAAMLHGVDLSPAMVAVAEKRGIYDHLAVESLQDALARDVAAWDLLVAADVLHYVGRLEAVFAAAARALAPGGLFAFVVEAMRDAERAGGDGSGMVLRDSRRYAHDQPVLLQHLAAAGFSVLAAEQALLRHDRGQPLAGLYVVAGRGAR